MDYVVARHIVEYVLATPEVTVHGTNCAVDEIPGFGLEFWYTYMGML